jgi:tetratricopeptide (TPR) repeat protein
MSVGLEAYLLWKQDGAKAAISGVTNHVGRGGQAGDPTISFLEAANIFEGLGGQTESSIDASGSDFYSAAESLLRENAKQSRREAIPLIAFLTRRSKLPEAVSIWKSQVDASAADEYAIAAAALAANSKLSSTNLDEIVERVKELRRDQPTKAVLAGLGQLYTFRGEHADAIAIHREMLANEPADTVAMNNLACYLALSGGDKTEALDLINKAINIEGPVAALLDSRGMILLEMNRPQDALLDIERAIQLAPSSSTYLHLAAARSRLKQEKESEEAMTKAHELGLDVNKLHPLERSRYSELLKHAAL